jgi:endonuclease-3
MSVEEIKEIIRPCGLSPMKSKGIHGLSHILIDKHGGKVPQSFEFLEELPAVGHKTPVSLCRRLCIAAFQ